MMFLLEIPLFTDFPYCLRFTQPAELPVSVVQSVELLSIVLSNVSQNMSIQQQVK